MSALLLGARGQVGSALARHFDQPITPARAQFDLSGIDLGSAVELIRGSGADVVVNCAAYTAVDRAESEAGAADAVNGTAVGILAAATAKVGVPFVTFSTDYVFDGKARLPYLESSVPVPINAYGRSKLLGERLALEANPQSLVIRTSWVISATHPNFVSTILQRARAREPLRVVDDQRGSPTIVDDLVSATVDAIAAGATGVVHLANRGEASWYELARTALEMSGLDGDLAQPITTEEHPTPAPRPAYTVLASERLSKLGMAGLPEWITSLSRVVEDLDASG